MNKTKVKLSSYISGYLLSLVLTFEAYLLVKHNVLRNWNLVFALIGLAVVQLMVQLIFFLHLGRESKPRWNLLAFGFMAIVVTILVFGSLWIMDSLNYHHDHSSSDPSTYIIQDEGIKK